MELSMAEVENLWEQGKLVPLGLAPIALWHLFEFQPPPEDKTMLNSEEHLGELF